MLTTYNLTIQNPMNQILEQSCKDILYKNMEYTGQSVYLLYDRESPLAIRLSDAWIDTLKDLEDVKIREFVSPPQPLYRGGLVNPDNPHAKEQNRFVTNHNITENAKT